MGVLIFRGKDPMYKERYDKRWIKGDDIGVVIKAHACVRTRGAKTLYFISSLYWG